MAANSFIVTVAAGSAAMLLRALLQLSGDVGADQIVVFYVGPAALALGLLWSFRASAETRINIALLLATLGTSMTVAEGLLLVSAQVTSGLPLTRSGDEAPQSLYDVVMEMRSQGNVAYPRVPATLLVDSEVDFRVGARHLYPVAPAPGRVTVVLCNGPEGTITYPSDRFGFDNVDSLWDQDSVDVVLIGDSYTHGVCVPRGKETAGRLRDRWSTLNLGMSGAGPLTELGILREYATDVATPVVVWDYYEGNDLTDLRVESGRDWLTAYLDPGYDQRLDAKRPAIDTQYESWLDSLIALGPGPVTGHVEARGPVQLVRDALRLRTLRTLAHFGVHFPRRQSVLGSLPGVLSRANDDVSSRGGRLLLVYIPSYARYDTWFGEGPPGHDELSRFAQEERIPMIDLDSAFRATGDPRSLWSNPRGHLNEAGYEIVAGSIAAALDSLGLVR